MTDLQLTPDEFMLFQKLAPDGTTRGNVTLRRSLGWNASRYRRAADGLVGHGIAERAGGQGGSLRRPADYAPAEDGTPPHKTLAPYGPEIALYDGIQSTLEGPWAQERRFKPLIFERTANLGSKSTGGIWTRPDFLTVGFKDFTYVPDREFEVITFEVKPVTQLNVTAVYEALAHRTRATHAIVLLQLHPNLTGYSQRHVDRVVKAAEPFGIGVTTFTDTENFATWEEILVPQRTVNEPRTIEAYLTDTLSENSKNKLATEIKRHHGLAG